LTRKKGGRGHTREKKRNKMNREALRSLWGGGVGVVGGGGGLGGGVVGGGGGFFFGGGVGGGGGGGGVVNPMKKLVDNPQPKSLQEKRGGEKKNPGEGRRKGHRHRLGRQKKKLLAKGKKGGPRGSREKNFVPKPKVSRRKGGVHGEKRSWEREKKSPISTKKPSEEKAESRRRARISEKKPHKKKKRKVGKRRGKGGFQATWKGKETLKQRLKGKERNGKETLEKN